VERRSRRDIRGAFQPVGAFRRFSPTLAISMLVLASSPAFANYSCQGKIHQLSVDPGGNVVVGAVGSGLSWVYLCNVSTTANSITPESCRGVLTTLLTASASGSDVVFWFNDSLTCTTHPSWAQLTGWYFGPTIENG